jgi:uncharacterized protein (TIGR02453 family)
VWPPAALDFLRELEANNDREWFKANRQRYDQDLLGPARELAEKLEAFGDPHYFRPYNNLRFRPGPPLKEHIAVAFGHGGSGGYYFHLSLDGFAVAAGLHNPEPDQLERFRAALNDSRTAGRLERAIASAEAAGLSPAQPELKRAPRGYPLDHPHIDRLRMKRVTVSQRRPLGTWLRRRSCDDWVRSEFEAARPLVQWLGEVVGPSTRARRD